MFGCTLSGALVTLISGLRVVGGVERSTTGALVTTSETVGGGGGGGGATGGGGGASADVTTGAVAVVGAVEASGIGPGALPAPEPRNASNTTDTTSATVAIDTAANTARLWPVRYQGACTGRKFHVLALNASKVGPASSGGGGLHPGSLKSSSSR